MIENQQKKQVPDQFVQYIRYQCVTGNETHSRPNWDPVACLPSKHAFFVLFIEQYNFATRWWWHMLWHNYAVNRGVHWRHHWLGPTNLSLERGAGVVQNLRWNPGERRGQLQARRQGIPASHFSGLRCGDSRNLKGKYLRNQFDNIFFCWTWFWNDDVFWKKASGPFDTLRIF